MSLIHAALREMSPKMTPSLGVMDYPPKQSAGRMQQLFFMLCGITLVAVIAAGLWFLWLSPKKNATSPQLATSTLISTPLMAAQSPFEKQINLRLDDESQQAASPVANVGKSALVIEGRKKNAVHEGKEANTKSALNALKPLSTQNSKKNPAVALEKPVAGAAVDPAVTDISIENRFGLLLQAVKINACPNAAEHLKVLQSQLPPSNVLRLRAEAWYALKTGDTTAARRAYSEILERTGSDEEASINLASIEAKDHRKELARQILADALRNNPDSEALRITLNRFNAPLGN